MKTAENTPSIILEDQSLRDGLQFEVRVISTQEKFRLFSLLAAAGVKRIQVGSFVHPQIVPQVADTDALVAMARAAYPLVTVTGLVLNEKGLDRAIESGLTHVDLSASVSDTHSRKNVNRSAAEALESMVGLVERAVTHGMTVRAGVQCAFGCVYEGAVPEAKVVDALSALAAAGAHELNLADTTGMANPLQIKRLTAKVRSAVPEKPLSLHLHDTRGLGLANLVAGYDAGITIFDVSAGGLGGCPFVKGASGNVPAEDAVNLFHQMGVETGIDLKALCKVVDHYEELLGRPLPGRINRVLKFQGVDV